MEQYDRLPVTVLDSFPAVDAAAVHRKYQEELTDFHRKIVVLDDDPTGVQTVHDVAVYTDWSQRSLAEGMREENNMFFLLTNSRSFTARKTETVHRTIAGRTLQAASDCGKKPLFILRGDSTLRGHYFTEAEMVRRVLEERTSVPVHGLVICPFFEEGGRYTIDSVHYVREGEWLIPAGQTEFAKDKTFGYRSSHLGEYAEEKSGGRYQKEDGIYITLSMLRAQEYEKITRRLMQAENFCPVIVDAVAQSDVETFAVCLLRAIKAGKEFLIRGAAALPKVLGNVGKRPLLDRKEILGAEKPDGKYGGLVLIGSHVKKTCRQLEALRQSQTAAEYLEFQVNACLHEGEAKKETERIILAAEKAMEQGKTAVVYTSRQLLSPEGMTKEEMLRLSVDISDAVTSVVTGLRCRPSFLIAKGGITSSDVGTRALQVHRALVMGQIQPGIPVWKTGPESKFPGLPYIIFPGNVGETDTLKKIVELLA